MKPSEKPEFVRHLIGLSAIKPGKGLTPEALEIWWASMQDWSLEDFMSGVARLAREVEFMPSPYHFEQLRKAGRPTAGEAFEIARRSFGSSIECGQVTHNGTCGDPLIDRAVRAIGGYGAIALCDRDKLPFLERRFVEHYASICEADDVRAAVPQIACASLPRLGAALKAIRHET